MEQLRVQTGGAIGGVDLSNGSATEVLPTTKTTEERARESDEKESFNVFNLLDFFFILFSGNRQIPGLATGAVGHSLFY